MAYGPEAELVFGASFGPPDASSGRGGDVPVEVHLLEREDAADEETMASRPPARMQTPAAAQRRGGLRGGPSSAFEREAMLVARRIQQLVRGGEGVVWDRAAGRYRPARYGDIAVLMRTVKHRANELINVLADADVPAYAELGTGYFAASEVETMLALLTVLDNPRQDIELAAVLRSPSAALMRKSWPACGCACREATFTTRSSPPRRATKPWAGCGTAFRRSWVSYRKPARGPAACLCPASFGACFGRPAILTMSGAMPGGRQRQANLRALHERARQFDTFARHGLARFLRFIQRLREAEGDLGAAPAVGESDDVVRVMSVHTSKGLQFPIVFVVDCGRQFQGPARPSGHRLSAGSRAWACASVDADAATVRTVASARGRHGSPAPRGAGRGDAPFVRSA